MKEKTFTQLPGAFRRPERWSALLFFALLALSPACEKESVLPADASFGQLTQAYAPQVDLLLENIDLDYPGLEAAKAAYLAGRPEQAMEALFAYFRQNPAGEVWREAEVSPININQPILDYLKDTYTFLGVKARVPRNKAGFLDWKFVPPGASDQFTHYLNRFPGLSHWVRAAKQTGSDTWSGFLNATLCDWVISNPYRTDRLPEPLAEESRSYEFGGANNYPWLILNAGVRLRAFQQAFYHMLRHDLMEPKTFILLLTSIEAHADFLYTRGGFNGDNWDNITLDALLKVATGFPEFKRSSLCKAAAADRYFSNLQKVGYDDGSQWELAGHYGMLVLNNAVQFFEQLAAAGVAIPPEMAEQQRKQVFYYACTADPDGFILPSNDSDPQENIREKISDFARRLSMPEALFMMTNGGEGTVPGGPPARFFDYAGNLISRDRWTDARHWSCFDIGPFGMGHNHADKLSLTIFNDRKILVDPGRFTYGSGNQWADYRQRTRAHNTVVIDDADQRMLADNGGRGLPGAVDDYLKNNPRSWLQTYDMARHTPIGRSEYHIGPDHDYARGRVTAGYEGGHFAGRAIHERGVWYERGEFWLVVDRLFSDRERDIEVFWHFHPDCRAVEMTAAGAVLSRDPGQGNLLIVPVQGGAPLQGRLIKGQESPFLQGWYSPAFNEWTASYDAVYAGRTVARAMLGWLIVPFSGGALPAASAVFDGHSDESASITVDIEGIGRKKIDLPLDKPPVL